jgi:cystathionine beta-synthase
MRLHDVSQLPVMEEGRIVGILDESDLLLAAHVEAKELGRPVREVMSTRLTTVVPSTPLEQLFPIFDAGLVPIVMDGSTFVGLVTRMDVLGYLRRRSQH